jgi:hypothetical protein
MSEKEKLYFLLKEFTAGYYDTKTFWRYASNICNLKLGQEELTPIEKESFGELCNTLNSFSPYKSDLQLGYFIGEKDLLKVVTVVSQKLHIKPDINDEKNLTNMIEKNLIKLAEELTPPQEVAKWALELLNSKYCELTNNPDIFNILTLISKANSQLQAGFPLYTPQDFKMWLTEFETIKQKSKSH